MAKIKSDINYGNIDIDLIIEKNAISETEQVPIKVKVSRNSKPIPAEIVLNINGKPVPGFSGPELTYLFGPHTIGSYDIMATASVGGLTERKAGKIEVIGDTSKARYLAEKMKLTAYGTITTSEYLAVNRLVDAEIEIATDKYFEFIGGRFSNSIISNFPEMKLAIANMIERFIKMLEGPLGDYTEDIINGVATPKAKANFIRTQMTLMEEYQIGPEALIGSIKASKAHINDESTNFKKYIDSNHEKFAYSSELENLFEIENKVIQNRINVPLDKSFNVFDAIKFKLKIISESELANFYDESTIWGNIIFDPGKQALVVIAFVCLGIFIILLIFQPAAAALAAYVVSMFSSYASLIGTILSCWKLFFVSCLIIMVPFVVEDIDNQHTNSIQNIKQNVEMNGQNDPLCIQVANTTLGIASEIDANGQTFIIAPDGQIIQSLMNIKDFISYKPGTYSVIAYQHKDRMFSDVGFKNFQVIKPNITLNLSYTLQNASVTVNLSFKNLGSTNIENSTAIFCITNSSGGMVLNMMEDISIDAGEQENLSYTVDLKDSDIYSAEAALSLVLPDILIGKKISIPVGIHTIEDAAILNIEYGDQYSPHENIGINVTMESYAPGLAFNISLPRFNYSKPVVLTGTQVINLTLPKLSPDYYVAGIIAERNGTVLDSKIISFYVQADGIGLLTFNTSQLLYPSAKSCPINLSLKDLNLTDINAIVGVKVFDPLEGERDYQAENASDGYQFYFLPATNGTYMLEAHASKEGWRIDNNTFTVIVDQMSPLNMSVTMGEYILANVTANGQPAACNVTIYTPQGNESVITSNGLALFNATNQFYIVADKMFFEPAFYSFEPHSISGTKFNDTNSNATRDPGEAGLSGWTIRLTRPDGSTINATTDANGSYKFENLTSGTYRVSEVRQDNWTQTYPAWLGDHIINVTDGNVTGVDFGNNYLPVPDIPFPPSGPAFGLPGAEYSYTTSAADPSGYQISYTFDWGDGTNSTTGLFESGAIASATHIWNSSGIYLVRAMATNSKGASSGWSAALEVDIAAGIAADKIGVFRNGPWYIDYNGNREWDPDSGDVAFWFGTGGDLPFAGDWSGDDVDEIGVFRNGPWYIDYNGNREWDPDSGDVSFWFGTSGDLPIAGDWNGDDIDEIGVFRNGPWYLDYNGNRVWDPASGDVSFWFGTSGDLPIAGDWNGDGKDEIGVFRNGPWYLDYNGNREWDPASGDVSFWLGTSGDAPLAGDWNSDGIDEIGVFRNGPWYLDYNGNREWDPASGDVSFWFGTTGDRPVKGRWGSLSSSLALDQDKTQLDLRETSAEKIRQKRAALEELQEESRVQVGEIKMAQEVL